MAELGLTVVEVVRERWDVVLPADGLIARFTEPGWAYEEEVARCVVSGVRDDEDVRVARLPLPRCDQSLKQLAQLPGGDGGGVVPGRRTKRVQGCGP